ncbi:hypothetical protein N9355_03265 [Crocinitomicaceae bacterium]|nr:hypothetical protein [Crocinitomicaceae bacterium]
MTRYVHIFRTELHGADCISKLTEVMSSHPKITRWHLDLEDVDNVLKVETESLSEACIISLAKEKQIVCEVLPD